MSSEKHKRNVRDMDVLNDIRGLLSTAPGEKSSGETGSEEDSNLQFQIGQYRLEIETLRQQVQQQHEELNGLRMSNEVISAKAELCHSTTPEPPVLLHPTAKQLADEIALLEAKQCDLASAVSELEELVQFNMKELSKRVARVYEEAGATDLAIDFRRTADQLQQAEDLACFVRALIR